MNVQNYVCWHVHILTRRATHGNLILILCTTAIKVKWDLDILNLFEDPPTVLTQIWLLEPGAVRNTFNKVMLNTIHSERAHTANGISILNTPLATFWAKLVCILVSSLAPRLPISLIRTLDPSRVHI